MTANARNYRRRQARLNVESYDRVPAPSFAGIAMHAVGMPAPHSGTMHAPAADGLALCPGRKVGRRVAKAVQEITCAACLAIRQRMGGGR